MNTYVSLINWTEQGIRDFRDTTQRAEAFAQAPTCKLRFTWKP
jgi:uncharacterized protein with GYD domain